jgi:hypothetical protein
MTSSLEVDFFDKYVLWFYVFIYIPNSIQAYSGVFHMLPLGLRVQDKLEGLIDKHMRSLGTIIYRTVQSLSLICIRCLQGLAFFNILSGTLGTVRQIDRGIRSRSTVHGIKRSTNQKPSYFGLMTGKILVFS